MGEKWTRIMTQIEEYLENINANAASGVVWPGPTSQYCSASHFDCLAMIASGEAESTQSGFFAYLCGQPLIGACTVCTRVLNVYYTCTLCYDWVWTGSGTVSSTMRSSSLRFNVLC